MAKILRTMLTAAVLTAIAVRLRRRADLPGPVALGREAPAVQTRGAFAHKGSRWPVVAVVVLVVAALVVTLVVVFMPDASRGDNGSPQLDPPAIPPGASATAAQEPAPSAMMSTGPAATADCFRSGPITARPISQPVRQAVNRQWRRIERWLRARAPRTYARLGGPGRARTIAVAEAQIGVGFPDDLRASLLRHDGMRGFGPDATILSTRQIRDTWRAECARERDDPGGMWRESAIPVLSIADGRERGGRYPVALDPATGRTGSAHYLVTLDPVTGLEGSSHYRGSYLDLLDSYAHALESGAPFAGNRARIRRGLLTWERAG